MIFKLEYNKLKNGRLSAVQKSSILSQFIIRSKHEWQDLQEAILNANQMTIQNSCQYVQEISSYFNFNQVLAIKDEIDEQANCNVFDISLYHKMINEWSRQLCKLRTKTPQEYNQMNLTG